MNEFIDWLSSQSAYRKVGVSQSFHDCPVANFYRAQGRRRTVFGFRGWKKRVVGVVDGQGKGVPITASWLLWEAFGIVHPRLRLKEKVYDLSKV